MTSANSPAALTFPSRTSTVSDRLAEFQGFSFSPLTEDDRARIARGMSQTFSGSFSTLLDSGPLPWRNLTELAALSLFELDLRVDEIEVTPEVAKVVVEGEAVSHIPAFRLRHGNALSVLDVMSDAKAQSPNRVALSLALKRAYATRGIRYAVLRKADVVAEPRHRNARLVLRCRRYDMGSETSLAIATTLSARGPHNVASVMMANAGTPNVREAVYALAARRHVAIDLWAHRPEDMKVSLAPRGSRR